MISWISMGNVRKEKRKGRKTIKKLEKQLQKEQEDNVKAVSKSFTKDLIPLPSDDEVA